MGLLAEGRYQAGFRHQVVEQGAEQIAQAGNVGSQVGHPADIILTRGQDIENSAVIRKGGGDIGRTRFRARGRFRRRWIAGCGGVAGGCRVAGTAAATGGKQAGAQQGTE